MKLKKKWILSLSALVLIVLIGWTLWGNTALEVNEYKIVSNRIPQGFNGFRIAQASDLHNAEFGEGNSKLIELLITAVTFMHKSRSVFLQGICNYYIVLWLHFLR